jgi:hypothetical protein
MGRIEGLCGDPTRKFAAIPSTFWYCDAAPGTKNAEDPRGAHSCRVDAAAAVRRLVCITGMGAGDTRSHRGFVFDWLITPLVLRKVYVDKNRQEDAVRASSTDLVLVRPSVLIDKPPCGRVRVLTDLEGFRGGAIARTDVAHFVVEQLTDDRWLRQSPLITW